MKRVRRIFLTIRKSKTGMTFIEVLIAALIMLPVILGVLEAYLYTAYVSELTKEKAIALNALSDMAEAIKCTPFSNIISDFPNGVNDGNLSNDYATLVGGYQLTSEHIVVTYVNTLSDPLEILIAINWHDIRGRTHTQSISTMRSR